MSIHPRAAGRALPPLAVEALEDRTCPSITFQFDYSLDVSGFFNDPAHRAALQQAGQILGARLTDSLAAITPGGSNSWTATVQDPSTGAQVKLSNLSIPANTLLIYAGGSGFAGTTVGEGGYGGWGASGSADWFNTVQTRGQPGVLNNTDFAPWGGSITFDVRTNWYFDDGAGIGPTQTDFVSVALHELGHVLGIGTSPSWQAQISGGAFHGPASTAANGGVPPAVTPDGYHWAAGTMTAQGPPEMTPAIQVGTTKAFTTLDFATLQDIGWQVAGGIPVSAPASAATAGALPPNRPGQTVGQYDPASGTWYQYGNGTSTTFVYGAPNWIPLVGAWSGGQEGIGVYDPATATFYLRNEDSSGAPDAGQFVYGAPGWIPIVGDWNGDGKDSVGVYDPATATFYLRNEDSSGAPDAGHFRYGLPGWVPLAGKWGGTGASGIGAFDPGTATWYLRSTASAGAADAGQFQYGAPGWTPVVGDWDGNGTVTVGVVDPATATWYLRNSNSPGAPDLTPFAYGAGGWRPTVGNWAGSAGTGRAPDRAPDQALGLPLLEALPGGSASSGTPGLVQGHMPGGYCHCALCQAALARASSPLPAPPPAAPLDHLFTLLG
jgi:hypothetical protein